VRLRAVLAGSATAVLALTVVPALAEEPVEPELLQPCDVAEGSDVLTVDGFTGTIETPSFLVGDERITRTFVLDLAGNPVGTTGTVDTTMTWAVPANDYDLEVYAGKASGLSESFQPIDPAEEHVRVTKVAHCGRVEVSAIDFTAPVVVDTLDLSMTVGAVAPLLPVQ
jgi:hypothetical protein